MSVLKALGLGFQVSTGALKFYSLKPNSKAQHAVDDINPALPIRRDTPVIPIVLGSLR